MRFSAITILAAVVLSGPAQAQSTPPASGTAQFIRINDNALLSSRIIGLNITSNSGEKLGTIEDVVFAGGQLSGIILSVGDVLGGSERYIAADPSALSVNYNEADGKWQAKMNAKLEQLKSAPEFRYEGKWKR